MQEAADLEDELALLVRLPSGQLQWAAPVLAFIDKVELDAQGIVERMRPLGKGSPVVIDPEVAFGVPQVRGIRTEVIAESYAEDGRWERVASAWQLSVDDVQAALQWELASRRTRRFAVAFYLDASIPFPVSKALALVRDDVLYPGGPACPITSPSTKDRDWLPVAGRHRWTVLMRDKHVRSRPGERKALQDSKVRAFVLTGAGNYSRRRILDLLVRRRPDIEEATATAGAPCLHAVTQHGWRRIQLDHG